MHPLVEKFLQGDLPEPMANALVGGSLPVPSIDLLQALAYAVFRETPFAPRAAETLESMPEGVLQGAIAGPVNPPDPLGLICRYRKEPALLEQAMLHEDFTSAWMERVVPHLPGSVLDLPLNNQVMWIERPIILDHLEEHPEGDYNLKRKIQEFRRDVLRLIAPEIAKERLELIDEVEAGRLDKAWAELPLPQEASDEESLTDHQARERAEKLLRSIKEEGGEEPTLTLTQRVMKLKTNQKIILAIKGGKEERTLLIRESNRLIQVAVVRNGRITEGEITYIAQMRTVTDEVLRIISMNREWMKKYPIVKNLVMNPRTPLPLAMNNLRRIREFDLKLMAKDRNVSEALRREAKRLAEPRGGTPQ
ncbi:MAG: hypothetical protein HY823_05805 [Acidobacteria bacterium]|nr:hypothetical protein [Acidobacteriota bacterium]